MFNYDELPPEIRISATPIGSGFVNVINLDDIDKEEIKRSLSPPLQNPRNTDSSDFTDSSDLDDDVIFVMRNKIPPRPPSRRQYIIERSKSPIEIAPVVNKKDIKRKEENELLKSRILQLQEFNEDLCTQIDKLQSENRILRNYITNKK